MRVGLLTAVFASANLAGASADCPPGQGQRVILAAEGANPDVFVFDSRERLARYVSGTWTSTKDIMAHTVLVSAGTLALVLQCRPGEVRVPYASSSLDVYGVRLLSGSHANRYGWVVGSDAHLQPKK
jgi:hypothetical protein